MSCAKQDTDRVEAQIHRLNTWLKYPAITDSPKDVCQACVWKQVLDPDLPDMSLTDFG